MKLTTVLLAAGAAGGAWYVMRRKPASDPPLDYVPPGIYDDDDYDDDEHDEPEKPEPEKPELDALDPSTSSPGWPKIAKDRDDWPVSFDGIRLTEANIVDAIRYAVESSACSPDVYPLLLIAGEAGIVLLPPDLQSRILTRCAGVYDRIIGDLPTLLDPSIECTTVRAYVNVARMLGAPVNAGMLMAKCGIL